MSNSELFKVVCITCRASLSVRNAALVGQIISCPRCHSMVEIAPPVEKTKAPAATPVAAAVVTPAVSTPPSASAEGASPTFEAPALEEPAAPEPANATPAPSFEAEQELLQAGNSIWGANPIVWAVTSFLVGASLTSAFLFFRGNPEAETPMAEVAIASPVESEEQDTSHTVPEGVAEPKPTASTETSRSPGDESDEGLAVTAEAMKPPTLPELPKEFDEPNQLDRNPPEPERTPAPQDRELPEAELEPKPRLVVEEAKPPRPPRRFDPRELDPEELDLASLDQVSEATSIAAEDFSSPSPDEVPRDDIELADEPAVKEPPAVEVVATFADQYRSLRASERLKQIVPGIAVKDMPLFDFCDLVGSLAGVPITLSPQHLQMAGIAPNAKVTLDVMQVSLGRALSEGLQPLRLEYQTAGAHISVVRREASNVRTIDYPVDDLQQGDVTSEDLAQWIQTLVEPSSWQSAGGQGTIEATAGKLRVSQPQTVQYPVLVLLERIRLASDLPLRSRFPQRLLERDSHLAAVASRLSAPTTFTFSQETPLEEVIRHWQSEIGMPLFIDWQSIGKVGFWPQSRITCASAQQPWQQALDEVLTPLGLGWRAVAGGSIEITSREKVTQEAQLDFYPLKSGTVAAGRLTAEQLQEVVPQNGANSVLAKQPALILDPAHDLLYCLQPAAAQRAIHQWLGEQGLLAGTE